MAVSLKKSVVSIKELFIVWLLFLPTFMNYSIIVFYFLSFRKFFFDSFRIILFLAYFHLVRLRKHLLIICEKILKGKKTFSLASRFKFKFVLPFISFLSFGENIVRKFPNVSLQKIKLFFLTFLPPWKQMLTQPENNQIKKLLFQFVLLG